jgi:carboxyl-terminal processing protease
MKNFRLLLLFVIFLYLASSVSVAEINEKQYSSLLFINQIYQLILSNYYESPAGIDLLNEGLKELYSELNIDENLMFLRKDLDNEKAFKEFTHIYLNTTSVYSGDFSNLSTGICEAMISSLKDKYSSLLRKEDYGNIQDLLKEHRITGLGFSLVERDEMVYITTVLPDSPSFSAGIKSGDMLHEIDGINIQGLSINKIYSILSKKQGDKTSLKISRDGEILMFSLEVQEFPLKEYILKDVGDNILYVKIYVFTDDVSADISSELQKKNYAGLILDVRDNPGGELQSALDFTKIFLSSEPIIMVRSNKGSQIIYGDNSSPLDIPIVLLVNNNTMSSAEIVASGLQMTKRAIIVGETTFGKGVIQGIFPLDSGLALRLTIKEFLTFSGGTINNCGIKPDIEINGEEAQLLKALEIIKSEF